MMTDEERLINVRSCYPHVQNGIVYLNHAATGPFSLPVQHAMSVVLDYLRG